LELGAGEHEALEFPPAISLALGLNMTGISKVMPDSAPLFRA
jgi:hypothetical protein